MARLKLIMKLFHIMHTLPSICAEVYVWYVKLHTYALVAGGVVCVAMVSVCTVKWNA